MNNDAQAILNFINSSPWAITPEGMGGILSLLRARTSMAPMQAPKVRAAAPKPKPGASGNIAMLNMCGPIVPKGSWITEFFGGCPLNQFTAQLRMAATDPTIKAIVINIDSSGGSVTGVPEAAAAIRAAAEGKHIVAVCTGLMASAAYWLGCQASEIVVTPSGEIGSIGVLVVHEDWSGAYAQAGIKATIIRTPAAKAEGNGIEPLTPAATADIQAKVDAIYSMFVKDVATGRGVSQAAARGPAFGQGRTFLAADAVKSGMADRVGTLQEVIAELGGGTMQQGGRMSATAQAAAAAATGVQPDHDFSESVRNTLALAQ